ncbi:hypothetical protein APHAL10511_005087 [Amanita phalloides]|nr:hypothetical protein APHAL10511_005087 [Amanita phalloides]
MTSAKELVESAISNNKIVIFSKTWCGYSTGAKRLFASEYKDEKPTVVELDIDKDGDAMQAYLLEKTGQRTVPNVFVNKTHIGGHDDTQKAHRNGTLKQLLA